MAAGARADQARPLAVEIDHVIDGDSLAVTRHGSAMEVRLWGIDAPEYDQPFSKAARKALHNMTAGRKGRLYIKYRDKYDRYVAVLEVDELLVNQEMVKEGHGWVYGRYCDEPICVHWESLQQRAKVNRRGLWRGSDPVPPWQWKARR